MNSDSVSEKTDKKQRNIFIALVRLIFVGTLFYSKKLFCWLFNKCPKCGERFVWYQIHKGQEEVRVKICAECYRLNFLNIIVKTGFIHGSAYIAAIFLFIIFVIFSFFGGCRADTDKGMNNSSSKTANDTHILK